MVFIKFVVGFTLLRLMIYWGSSFFAFSFLVSRNALVCVFICFFIVGYGLIERTAQKRF